VGVALGAGVQEPRNIVHVGKVYGSQGFGQAGRGRVRRCTCSYASAASGSIATCRRTVTR
jgi:hypothetical protein